MLSMGHDDSIMTVRTTAFLEIRGYDPLHQVRISE